VLSKDGIVYDVQKTVSLPTGFVRLARKNILIRLKKLFSWFENIFSKLGYLFSSLGYKFSSLENNFSSRNKLFITVYF
jgi:hypothetical protein